jgi:hypothetical protein
MFLETVFLASAALYVGSVLAFVLALVWRG